MIVLIQNNEPNSVIVSKCSDDIRVHFLVGSSMKRFCRDCSFSVVLEPGIASKQNDIDEVFMPFLV